MKTTARIVLCLTVLAACPLVGRAAVTVAFPYSNNFDSDTVGTSNDASFSAQKNSNANASTWTIANPGGGANNVLQHILTDTTSGSGFGTNLVQATALGSSHQNFSLSTDFQVSTAAQTSGAPNPNPNGPYYTGLIALANNVNVPNAGALTGYWAYVSSAGVLNIASFTSGTSFTTLTGATANLGFGLNTTDTYTLVLTGTYTGSALVLSATLTDTTTLATATATSASITTPSTGNYFGYGDRITNTSTTLVMNYDNFDLDTLAVPEPSETSLLLGSLAILALALVLRRKSPQASKTPA